MNLSMTVINNSLYAIDGMSKGSTLGGEIALQAYGAKSWAEMPPLIVSRFGSCIASCVHGDKLYVSGGAWWTDPIGSDDTVFLASVERYDSVKKTWEEMAPMLTPRCDHAMAVLGGKLYVVGGTGGNEVGGDFLNVVERYDPEKNVWETVAPMAAVREKMALAVLGCKLYAIGGMSSKSDGPGDNTLNVVERYDPVANCWDTLTPMTTHRASCGAVALQGKLYAIGGYDDESNAIRSVERYDPEEDAWEEMPPLGTARYPGGSCFVVDKRCLFATESCSLAV